MDAALEDPLIILGTVSEGYVGLHSDFRFRFVNRAALPILGKLLALTAWLITVLLPKMSLAQQRPAVKKTIDSYIAQQMKEAEGSIIHPSVTWRRDIIGDLNHDGIPDAATLYILVGEHDANSHNQYLMVFLRSKTGALRPETRLKVGGKMVADFDSMEIRKGIIRLTGLRLQPGDPACCPTGKIDIRFALHDHHLQVVPGIIADFGQQPLWDSNPDEGWRRFNEAERFWAEHHGRGNK
jgi:hypothetical protein